MLGTFFNGGRWGGRWGGWRGGVRWIALLGFGGVLGFAIWNDVSEGGINTVQVIEAKKLQKKYDEAMLTAQGAVRKAHGDSLAACGGEVTDECRATAQEAARKAALASLTGSGCVAWEMSEWTPTRESLDPAKPKSRTEAEAACAFAADELAQRMSDWSRKQGSQ